MAQAYAFNENTAKARRFFEKVGGFETFGIDLFDTFIIDEKLATDPGTDDTDNPAYRGFVQQRANARKKLATAAKHLPNGEAFDIVVKEAGKVWEIKPWADSAEDQFKDVGIIVRKHAEGRIKELKTLRRLAEDKYQAGDQTVEQIVQMQGILMAGALKMEARISAEAARYEAAYQAAISYVQGLLENGQASGAPLLEDDDDDDDE
jgi:hypothetical protein